MSKHPPTTRKKRKKANARRIRDPLQVQISARVKAPGGRSITGQVLREAIAYRLRTGRDPRGITLKIVQWRNPGRTRADLRAWRVGPQEAAWGTLSQALAGWLSEAKQDITLALVEPRSLRRGQEPRR